MFTADMAFADDEVDVNSAVLTVHVNQPGVVISPLLYGAFFEEISHAGDGGLYAEMVNNRSFANSKQQPVEWSLVTSGNAIGSIALDSNNPLNTVQAQSLKLCINQVGTGQRVGIMNDGYWGMRLHAGANYALSFYARSEGRFNGELTASLESKSRTNYGRTFIRGLSSEWKLFKTTLTAQENETAGRLVISANAPGTIWFDLVSLMPEKTWRNHGLQPELAEMIVDMKPAFLRFPGGSFTSWWRWKKTIGDISERPSQPNTWGYNATNGIGYHEYLQMSEDLRAVPVFCITADLGGPRGQPEEQLSDYVQDALDAIEYANGPVTSKWGQLRAKAGHPKPFGLRFMEIGNELAGDLYEQRFKQFAGAIRAYIRR